MKKIAFRAPVWALGVGLLSNLMALSSAFAEPGGDPIKGAALFATHCAECHSVKEGKDKKGPSLYAILGAKAAMREGFVYSDALKTSQIVWNAEELSRYIANPKTRVPGGKMKYDGLANASERADLVAYLANQGKR